MRKLRVIYLILSVLIPLPKCQAQTGGWQVVEALPATTPITIRARHTVRCRFRNATDDMISCEQEFSALRWARTLTFDRNSVQQVRIDHPTASMFAGAAIGAGVGVAVGATTSSTTFTRGATEVIAGGIFGAFGGLVGRETRIVPGKTIYQK
jgi:hypothetical protein